MKKLFFVTYRGNIPALYDSIYVYAETESEAINLAIKGGVGTHPLISNYLNKACRWHVTKA